MEDLLSAAIAPPALRAGQTIGVCAPAGWCLPARLRPGVERLAAEAPLRLGPVAQRMLDGRARPPGVPDYLAGSDDERVSELDDLLRDPDVRAIVLVRGGYGIGRILPRLDATALRADPKPILGFSDATALLAWALHAGVRPIHGPVLVQLPDLPAEDLAGMLRALRSPAAAGVVATGLSGNARHAEGRLAGGNLKLLAQAIGTPWAMPLADALLLIEDVGERPYALDRCLTQLLQSGALAGARAAILGDLTRCTEPPHVAGAVDDPEPAFAAVGERLAAASVPCVRGLPFGHGGRNLSLPLGARAVLDAGTLTVLDSGVS